MLCCWIGSLVIPQQKLMDCYRHICHWVPFIVLCSVPAKTWNPLFSEKETNTNSVTLHPLGTQLKTYTGKKSNKCSHLDFASWFGSVLRNPSKTHRPFWNTFENTQQRQIWWMLPVWLCISSGRQFENTFEKKHMAESRTNAIYCNHARQAFENTQCREIEEEQARKAPSYASTKPKLRLTHWLTDREVYSY